MSGKHWTGKDVELLKLKFFEIDKKENLAEYFPNRSATSVMNKANGLGLTRRKIWNDDEVKILVDNYPTKTLDELAFLIPRWCEREITCKADNMRLNKTKEYRSLHHNGYSIGHVHSDEVIKVLKDKWTERKSKEDWKHSWEGKKHSEKTKQKMSDYRKKWFETNNQPMKGKKFSEEVKKHFCVKKQWTEEGLQRIRDSVMSKPHGGYGNWTEYIRKDGRVIKLQSSYEVRLAKAMDKWNLKWEKLSGQIKISYIAIDGLKHVHYPDFQVEDDYIFEAKGEQLIELDKNTRLKIEAGKKEFGDKYKVFGLDLIEEFENKGLKMFAL